MKTASTETSSVSRAGMRQARTNWLWTLGAFGLLTIFSVEAVFRFYLEHTLGSGQGIWLLGISYRWYPSEVLMFGLMLWVSPLAAFWGFFQSREARRLMVCWAIYVAIGGFSAFRGYYLHELPLQVVVRDLRLFFVPAMAFPVFYILGLRADSVLLARLLDWLGFLLTIVACVFGFAFLAGDIPRTSPFYPYFTAGNILTYFFLVRLYRLAVRWSITDAVLAVAMLFGIVSALQKPAIALLSCALLLCYPALLASRLGDQVRRRVWLMVGPVLGVLALLAISIAIDQLSAGFASEYLERRFLKANVDVNQVDLFSGRMEAWSWTWEQFSGAPILGTGLGDAYGIALPTGDYLACSAHNMPLTFLQQNGMVGFVLAAALYFALLRAVWVKAGHNRDPHTGAHAMAALVWCLALTVSSLWGSPIGVTCLGYTYFGLLALAVALPANRGWPKGPTSSVPSVPRVRT